MLEKRNRAFSIMGFPYEQKSLAYESQATPSLSRSRDAFNSYNPGFVAFLMGVTPAAFAAVQLANLNSARPVGVGVIDGVGVIFFVTFLVNTTAIAELLQDFTFVLRKVASIGSTDN
jgi:hypothetical protein